MKDSKTSGNHNGTQPLPDTQIHICADLSAALADIIAGNPPQGLSELRDTLWGIRSEFDPASVTMSSTNIPDAIIKLSSVLTETSEASQKVFDLVDAQNKIAKQGEKYLGELEFLAQQSKIEPAVIMRFVEKYRALNSNMHKVSHDIVISQEFQDLCGQKIKKVMRLVCDVECFLRALLAQLRVEMPHAKTASELEEERAVDQDETDSLLKELGL